MRRPTAVILGTVLGSALLVGARLSAHPVNADTAVAGAPGDVLRSDADAAGPSPVAGTPSATPRTTGTPMTKSPPKPSTKDTASVTEPSSQTSGDLNTGTFAGVAVTHKYGTLQVTITVSHGRISGIVESYQTTLELSKRINAEALPQLRQEALTAQSADINTISGATYTSDAYRASLQSALDKANG